MRFLVVWVCLWGAVWASDLGERIERVLEEGDQTALVGIEVYSMRKGKVIYERNAKKRFVPASTLKVVTGAAALDRLGDESVFETQLVVDGDRGYLVGSGDPSFGLGDLEKLVLQFKGKELLVDGGIFEGPVMGPGWMWDEEPAFWSVPMAGINLDHNFIEGFVVEKPEVLAAVLAGALYERRGDRVLVRVGESRGGEVSAVHRSESLGELLKVSLKESDNLYADCFFRKLGSSWERSSEIVGEFLKEKVGIDPEEVRIVDGSGLSRYNLMTPHQMVEVLKVMHGNRVFREALSVAGVDGTLKKRMKDLLVSGKTGGMTGVCSLCGYLMSREEGELVFTIFVNNYVKDGSEIRAMIDQVCRVLSK